MRFGLCVWQVVGKSYKLSVMKLLQRKRMKETGGGGAAGGVSAATTPTAAALAAAAAAGSVSASAASSEQATPSSTAAVASPSSEGYFCSELVAEALIQLGVMSPELDPAWFWPGSFESGDAVDQALLPGAVLEKEVRASHCDFPPCVDLHTGPVGSAC